MVGIPGGTFIIGSPAHEAKRKRNEGPRRAVTIPTPTTRSYALGFRVARTWP